MTRCVSDGGDAALRTCGRAWGVAAEDEEEDEDEDEDEDDEDDEDDGQNRQLCVRSRWSGAGALCVESALVFASAALCVLALFGC
jgi:hypothetical protein